MTFSCNRFRAAALIAIFALVPMLRAADGQIDLRIDPTSGATINASGSYVLVENVTMSANVPAINLGGGAADVTIDLNGHTITGTGSGAGAHAINGGATALHIYNGSIRTFGGIGISLASGDDLHAHDITIFDCDGGGISCNTRAKVSRVNIVSCTGDGIITASRATIRDCIIESITGTGIAVQSNSLVSGCSVTGASADGIRTTTNSVIENCVADANNTAGNNSGIEVGDDSIVRNCTASNNISSAASTPSAGISAGANCVIQSNTANGNRGLGAPSQGIIVGANSQVIGNTAAKNGNNHDAFGIDVGDGCLVMNNTCADNDTSNSARNAYGIRVTNNSRVIGNLCMRNSVDLNPGGGQASGIRVTGTGNTIVQNTSNNHQAIGGSFGIRLDATATHNLVAENSTHSNTQGIHLANLLVAGAENRCELNRTTETFGVVEAVVGANSMGVGDLANVGY